MSKPLTHTDIRANLAKFVVEWESSAGYEKGDSQSFWTELLACFGIERRRVAVFERDAERATTGNRGFIDVFWPGVMIGEQKSAGKSLVDAEQQAVDYLSGGSISAHEFPRHVVTSDFRRFRVTDLEAAAGSAATVEFELADLADHAGTLAFLAGYETITKTEEKDASIDASKIMARLFTAMVGEDVDLGVGEEAPADADDEDERTERASVFLTRLLFLLYGDDAGLWRADLFYEFVLNHTAVDGSDLGGQLATLFDVLNTPENRRRNVPAEFAVFPYVNGSLYGDRVPVEFFDREGREALLDACRFRWTRISPAVFGAMFQLVKSKEARREAGEHYTSEKNILKTLDPLFLDDLRAEAGRLIRAKSTTVKALRAFRDRLSTMTFLDPACGCGNFLVVAYRELRSIETDIIVAIRTREGQQGAALDATWETKVTIDQFHGFEINWWPAKIAETAMFLVDHHANRELAAAIGQAPDRLPITITAHIHHVNALRSEWAQLVPASAGPAYVFGNPPFLGHATRTPEQSQELRDVWGGTTDISRLDYVTGWHALTLDYMESRPGAWGYVTTNSITQGDQVPRLFGPIFEGRWRIKYAHRTFAWDSEAPGKAAVHCVIVGFTRDLDARPRLFDYSTPHSEPVEQTVEQRINAYLVDGPNVLVAKTNTPISAEIRPATFGNMARDDGNLLVEVDEYEKVIADPYAAKYVRPFRGSRELLHGLDRWCLWMVDLDPADVTRSPELRKRLEAVREFRSKSSASSTRDMAATPHLFGQRSHQDIDYLCIPRHVSATRRYFIAARYDRHIISGDANFVIPDPDGSLFALLSSSMFITWQRTTGGRIKSDLRFASTLTWNTFPVPSLDAATRAQIIKAGQDVLDARALHPERTLADAYNPLAMDPTLVKMHDALDRVVDKAFGATRKLTSEKQRLELLFASYARLTSSE